MKEYRELDIMHAYIRIGGNKYRYTERLLEDIAIF
jgi:hypothetical protein